MRAEKVFRGEVHADTLTALHTSQLDKDVAVGKGAAPTRGPSEGQKSMLLPIGATRLILRGIAGKRNPANPIVVVAGRLQVRRAGRD